MILAKDIKTNASKHENSNTMIIGSPGTGKSRSIVLPSILSEERNSMVILDPKGELYDMTKDYLKVEKGYNVQKIDFNNPKDSTVNYNPIRYVENEDDICKLNGILVDDATNHDPFWSYSSRMLLNALVAYLIKYCPSHQHTLESIRKLAAAAGVIDNEQKSKLDRIFDEVMARDSNSWALKQYCAVKTSADKTWQCIIISLLCEFTGILTPNVVELTNKDTIELEKIGQRKTALFVCSSDIDRSKDKLIKVLFTQLFQVLYKEADKTKEHCLKVPVSIYLDDYGCNLSINRFDSIVASCRGRGISVIPVLQSVDQLLKSSPNEYTAIINSMNNIVFLGGSDICTCEDMSKRLNVPLEDVLYKSYSQIYVFRQGQKPVITERFDLESMSEYRQITHKEADSYYDLYERSA